MNTDNTRTKHKKSFYKLKRFYIPILIIFVLFIFCAILLYRPVKLIYWGAVDYELKEQGKIVVNIYTCDTNEIDEIIYYIRNSKQDFVIAHYLGFGEEYLGTGILITWLKLGHLMENTYNTQKNIKECVDKSLENAIVEKEIKYIQYFESLFQFIKLHNYYDNFVYKNFMNMAMIALYDGFITSLYTTNRLCLFENKEYFLNKFIDSYDDLENIILNEKMNQALRNKNSWGNYNNMIKFYQQKISIAREKFNACKR